DFTLQGGQTLADVVTDLTTGDLRIGIHVIGFSSGGSESFINTPVPEPGTAVLLGAGLAATALARRRSRT
ncbi:MAG: PEP-CTERM sorting domain-containing protein, partial [Myxococcota bacterium]